MKKTIDIREKIAVRAYYAWLNGSTASAETNWLEAEHFEQAHAERRAKAKAPSALAAAKRRPTTQVLATH